MNRFTQENTYQTEDFPVVGCQRADELAKENARLREALRTERVQRKDESEHYQNEIEDLNSRAVRAEAERDHAHEALRQHGITVVEDKSCVGRLETSAEADALGKPVDFTEEHKRDCEETIGVIGDSPKLPDALPPCPNCGGCPGWTTPRRIGDSDQYRGQYQCVDCGMAAPEAVGTITHHENTCNPAARRNWAEMHEKFQVVDRVRELIGECSFYLHYGPEHERNREITSVDDLMGVTGE